MGPSPIAPVILAEKVSEWFDIAVESPYMLLVANKHKNKKVSLSR